MKIFLSKSWQRSECSLCSVSKPLCQWKEPRSFLPLKLGIEQMNKVPGKIKVSYVLVEIFGCPSNIPKRPSIANIGILYNYGPGERGMNAQRLLVQSENTRTFVRTSAWANRFLDACFKKNIPPSLRFLLFPGFFPSFPGPYFRHQLRHTHLSMGLFSILRIN